MDPSRPLAITMGDPCGIGPEIIVRSLAARGAGLDAVVIGDPARLRRAAGLVGLDTEFEVVDRITGSVRPANHVRVLPVAEVTDHLAFGIVDGLAGKAAYGAVISAIDLALSGEVSGIVTAPVNKAALALAGVGHPGHTEILAERAGVASVSMMLANEDIRTVLVTIHVALRAVPDLISIDEELRAIGHAHDAGRALGIAAPRIAVAGLNPHAGEDGLFGSEEEEIIRPAIEAARDIGIDASGPWSGDTVFARARDGRFDMVVAQYHDQGLIPVKYLGLDQGVNVTLGLPFVRTSPDHGTAFDIAGQGTADHRSMLSAIAMAERLGVVR